MIKPVWSKSFDMASLNAPSKAAFALAPERDAPPTFHATTVSDWIPWPVTVLANTICPSGSFTCTFKVTSATACSGNPLNSL